MKNRPVEPEELFGAYTALITPMLDGDGISNPIDYSKLKKLIDDQAQSGIRGFVVAGTTGQSSTLSHEEHVELASEVFRYVFSKYPNLKVIVGAGSNCTKEAIDLSCRIEEAIGPSTFLHVTGYYNNPPQEGIDKHFRKLSESIPRSNIILYNVPGRTNSRIELDTLVALSSVENIVGVKDAAGDVPVLKALAERTRGNKFVILAGEDHIVADIMAVGGRGVISASANLAPKYFADITALALAGDMNDAYKLQREVNQLVKEGVFYRKNPIPLAHMFKTSLRLPLVKLPQIEEHLRKVLASYNSEMLGINLDDYRG